MDRLRGLESAEAEARLKRFGANELPRRPSRGIVRIAFETVREPMFLLMLGATLLYLTMGELAEGLFLVAAAIAAMGLVIVQENRSERTLTALRELAQPHVRVMRDGAERRLAASNLVPGDILLIAEGERLPADAILLAGDMLSVDESALTGESAPVTKRAALPDEQPEGAPGSALGPTLFAGAMVVRGQAVAEIVRTGPSSALGRIGASLAAITREPTPLQKTAGRLVAWLGVLALGFCLLVVVAYGALRHDWVAGALAGITAAIALVPEEFPMVLTVFLALGTWRLASHRVLVRRGAVVEALGAATVLCVDKTGTLTENQMRVARLWTPEGEVEAGSHAALNAPAQALLDLAGLASAVRPVDPMDKAVRAFLATSRGATRATGTAPERSWPVRPERMALVQTWRATGDARITAAKGAPETITGLCASSEADTSHLMEVVEDYAVAGFRVLAVASCTTDGPFPDDPASVRFEFSGLIAFEDPVRSDVPAALAEARGAGIDVIMITGDHPATARAIAMTAGLDVSAGVLTGPELRDLPFDNLRERLRQVRVFARITPDQKLRIVEALKANDGVVAMTGDGINDAPALEAAHIGIAMGRRGTDVAREASDLVLLDDSFASIIGGVRLGRRIFVNLRRALIYVTAIHVPLAGVAILPILLGMPPILYPMHVVLLEFAIDPICALVFEGEPSDAATMRRPPRPADEPLFGLAQAGLALLQGGVLLIGVFGLYAWGLTSYPAAEARGAAFATLVLGNLGLAMADAVSDDGKIFAAHHQIFALIAAAAVLLLVVVLVVPPAATMFQIQWPSPLMVTAAVAVSVVTSGCWGFFRHLRRT